MKFILVILLLFSFSAMAQKYQYLDNAVVSNGKDIIDLKNLKPNLIISPINPTNPTKAKTISRYGNYVAMSLAHGYGGFALFNISDIFYPKYLGKGASAWSVNKSIFLNENRLLLIVDNNTANIESWDISNKSSPIRNQIVNVAGSNKFYDFDVNETKTLAAVADTNTGVHIFDISNPIAITKISGIVGNAGNIRIKNNNLYYSDYIAKNIYQYDISNPLLPVLTGTFIITGSTTPTGLEVSDNENYIIAYEDSLSKFYHFKKVGSTYTLNKTVTLPMGILGAQGSGGIILDQARNRFYVNDGYGIYLYNLVNASFLNVHYPITGNIFGCTSNEQCFKDGYIIYSARTPDRVTLIKDFN